MQYCLTNVASVIKKVEDDGLVKFIPADPANSDWQEYQSWLAADPENNVPLPAE